MDEAINFGYSQKEIPHEEFILDHYGQALVKIDAKAKWIILKREEDVTREIDKIHYQRHIKSLMMETESEKKRNIICWGSNTDLRLQ